MTDQPTERDERDAALRAAERIIVGLREGGLLRWVAAVIREEIAKDHDSLRAELAEMTAIRDQVADNNAVMLNDLAYAYEREKSVRAENERLKRRTVELCEQLQKANARISEYTKLLDKAYGTPCEQIRAEEKAARYRGKIRRLLHSGLSLTQVTEDFLEGVISHINNNHFISTKQAAVVDRIIGENTN